MDQIKTGRFIAAERKRRSLTQRQLAELLNISDKTVSKWECGNGFPEISLLLPLCKELEVSVNELLSGERISEPDYRRKAEKNMMDMIREKEENKKRMASTAVTGIIATVAFLTLLFVVAFYTDVISLPVKIILIGIACLIFAVGLYVAMQGERTIGYYKCAKCSNLFVPTFWAYTMGMHMLTVRHLKCPKCGRSSWCKKVFAKDVQP